MSGYKKDWYTKNRARISQERKDRYATDPEYRANIIKRSAESRAKNEGITPPPGYMYTYADVCKLMGVSVWKMRGWREKNWFPEPNGKDGRLWFTTHQLELLDKLNKFLQDNGSRHSESQKDKLSDLVNLIYSNWD